MTRHIRFNASALLIRKVVVAQSISVYKASEETGLTMWTTTILPFMVLVSTFVTPSNGRLTDEMVTASNAFSIDLMKTIFSSANGQANTIMSPVSLSVILALVQQGSGGTTLNELNQALHAQPASTREGYRNLLQELGGSHRDITLEIANKLYVKTGFDILEAFKNITVQDFHSDIETLDFSDTQHAADTINSWASNNTRQKIQSIVTPDMITPDTVMMLLNAVYFSGEWDKVFTQSATNMQPFTTIDGSSKNVATMHHTRQILAGGHSPDIGAKYVHLPFMNTQFSMLLLVPDAVDGLSSVLNALTAQKLASLLGESETRYVDLALPKYKFGTTSELVPILKSMGVNDLFENSANLTGIAPLALKASEVVQKAEIEVDEKGAKAAAVTGLHAVTYSLPRPNREEFVEIKADHPFMFFIVQRSTNIPLFSGWVVQP